MDDLSLNASIIILSFLGFLLSVYIHNSKITKKRLICPRKADCNSVINSDYSKVFGVPVEVLGMFYYALIFGYYVTFGTLQILLWGLIGNSLVLFLITLGAAIFSTYLIFVQAFKIRQWCLWCIGSAIISILIFIISLNNFLT